MSFFADYALYKLYRIVRSFPHRVAVKDVLFPVELYELRIGEGFDCPFRIRQRYKRIVASVNDERFAGILRHQCINIKGQYILIINPPDGFPEQLRCGR